MLIRNETPFAAIGFSHLHRDGDMMAVIAVRAAYVLAPEGKLTIAPQQELVLTDTYDGDPHHTPLLRSSDLIPFKPGTDITVLGRAHAPGGKSARTWGVSVSVGVHQASLHVYGPRHWEPALEWMTPTWKLGTPQFATEVDLDWRLAAGGRLVGDPDGDADHRNPIGPGLLDKDLTRRGRPFRAPQIDSIDNPVADPFVRPDPQGFGPVPPFWSWRQRYAGTYDEAWQSGRAPKLPQDFDYRFFRSAPPALLLPRMHGDETIRLRCLTPHRESLSFELPDVVLATEHVWRDARRLSTRLLLDGIHLDLRKQTWAVDLTWRGWIETCPAYVGAILRTLDKALADELPTSSEYGLVEIRRTS